MSRIGTPAKRMGARVRLGKMNEDIDYTPHQFREMGVIQRVASPEEQKRGIVGYTARAPVTVERLKEKNVDFINRKIKELGKKKKKAPESASKIFEEGQQILDDISKKQKQAKKIKELIPFPMIERRVGEYLDFKKNVVDSYMSEINKVQNQIKRSKDYQDKLRDRRRDADGERKIRYTYWRRDEREHERALRSQLRVLEEYKNKNLKGIRFGEEISYIPIEPVADHAKKVREGKYTGRWQARGRQAVAKYRHDQAIDQEAEKLRKDHPHLTKEKAKEVVRDALEKEKKYYDIPQPKRFITARKAIGEKLWR